MDTVVNIKKDGPTFPVSINRFKKVPGESTLLEDAARSQSGSTVPE